MKKTLFAMVMFVCVTIFLSGCEQKSDKLVVAMELAYPPLKPKMKKVNLSLVQLLERQAIILMVLSPMPKVSSH